MNFKHDILFLNVHIFVKQMQGNCKLVALDI